MGYRLGVDVGGTFTEAQMQAADTGEVTPVKVLSTPEDQSVGVLEGVREACRRVGASPQDLSLILHGSTVVTNLVLESKDARCGLLTTVGSEQILHLARAWTPGPLYRWIGMTKPSPLAEPWHTRGVGGRIAADGTEVEPLDEEGVREAIDALVADGVESVTIGLLNSYVNPDHERRAREIAHASHPELPISISSDLVSEYREYERTLTAVLKDTYLEACDAILDRTRGGVIELIRTHLPDGERFEFEDLAADDGLDGHSWWPLVSVDEARSEYGVAVSRAGEVDDTATAAAREEAISARGEVAEFDFRPAARPQRTRGANRRRAARVRLLDDDGEPRKRRRRLREGLRIEGTRPCT